MKKFGLARKIASNTIYQIVGKVVSMSITVFATLQIIKVYGRSGYGEFSLMQSWPAFVFIIVDFGINAIATRELSKDWSKASKYLGNILIFRSVLSLIAIGILYIILFFTPYSSDLRLGISLGLFLIFIQSLYTTTNIFFQVKLRYDLSVIGYVAGYLFILLSVLILPRFSIPLMYVNFAYVIGGFITFVLNYNFVVHLLGVKPDFKVDMKLLKYLFMSALPLGIMFIFSQFSFKEDALLLSVMKLPVNYGLNNTDTVAVYALPYKIFEVCLIIPTFFMNAAYPVLVTKMEEGEKAIKKAFKMTILSLAISGIISSIIGWIFSPLAISLFGGSDFSQSVTILRILISGLTLYYLTSPISWLIVTLGYQRKLPYIYLSSAIFNIIGNLIFIPLYSFYAAAVTTQLSEVLILVLLTLTVVRSWKEKYA